MRSRQRLRRKHHVHKKRSNNQRSPRRPHGPGRKQASRRGLRKAGAERREGQVGEAEPWERAEGKRKLQIMLVLFGKWCRLEADKETQPKHYEIKNMNTITAPSKSADKIIEFIRKGGRAFIPTCTRITVLDSKVLARFEKVGSWLLKEDGDGYRMRSGKGSVFILPGQLKLES